MIQIFHFVIFLLAAREPVYKYPAWNFAIASLETHAVEEMHTGVV
jgi:hypothetical protein